MTRSQSKAAACVGIKAFELVGEEAAAAKLCLRRMKRKHPEITLQALAEYLLPEFIELAMIDCTFRNETASNAVDRIEEGRWAASKARINTSDPQSATARGVAAPPSSVSRKKGGKP